MTDSGGRNLIHARPMKNAPVFSRFPGHEMDYSPPLFPRLQTLLQRSRVARVLRSPAADRQECPADQRQEVVPLLRIHKKLRAEHPSAELLKQLGFAPAPVTAAHHEIFLYCQEILALQTDSPGLDLPEDGPRAQKDSRVHPCSVAKKWRPVGAQREPIAARRVACLVRRLRLPRAVVARAHERLAVGPPERAHCLFARQRKAHIPRE